MLYLIEFWRLTKKVRATNLHWISVKLVKQNRTLQLEWTYKDHLVQLQLKHLSSLHLFLHMTVYWRVSLSFEGLIQQHYFSFLTSALSICNNLKNLGHASSPEGLFPLAWCQCHCPSVNVPLHLSHTFMGYLEQISIQVSEDSSQTGRPAKVLVCQVTPEPLLYCTSFLFYVHLRQ